MLAVLYRFLIFIIQESRLPFNHPGCFFRSLFVVSYRTGTGYNRPLMDEVKRLQQTIQELEARLAELKERLPAHSIPPAMIAELDELDEQIEQARARLIELGNNSSNYPRSSNARQETFI
jgi:hypothetical protein